MRHTSREALVLGSLSMGGFLALWEVASLFGWLSATYFPPPTAIASAGYAEIQQPRFWEDLRTSVTEFAIGYGLALALGIPAGLAIGWYRRVFYLLEPQLNFLYALPRIAFLPLLLMWFGIGIWSKVAAVFSGAFVTIVINTLHGVRTTDDRFLAVAKSYGARDLTIFRTVVFPSTVPFIVAGSRLGVARAIIGVVVAELYASSAGLGYMIVLASNNLQMDRVLFAVFVLIVMGLLTVHALGLVERRFAAWRHDVGSG